MSLIENYRISSCELSVSLLTFSGAAYIPRHFNKMVNRENGWLGHCILWIIECIPGVGLIALAIERIFYGCLIRSRELMIAVQDEENLPTIPTNHSIPFSLRSVSETNGLWPEDRNQIFQIFAKHLNGRTYTLDVLRSTTIAEMEIQLVKKSRIPLQWNASFVYAGKRPSAKDTVESILLGKEGTLHVALRPAPRNPEFSANKYRVNVET